VLNACKPLARYCGPIGIVRSHNNKRRSSWPVSPETVVKQGSPFQQPVGFEQPSGHVPSTMQKEWELLREM
jgi:hypothetical protein